jgi:hypothetical protein
LAEIHWYEAHGIRARRPGRARRRLAGHRRERRGLPVFAHPARGLAVGEPGPGATSRGSRMLANVGPTARRNSLPIVDCRCDDSTHEFRATAVSPHITRVRPGRLKIPRPARPVWVRLPPPARLRCSLRSQLRRCRHACGAELRGSNLEVRLPATRSQQ